MTAQLTHIAVTSQNMTHADFFYQKLFDLQLGGGATGSDGYVGLNIRTQRPGRRGGFDHFGFKVENLTDLLAKIDKEYPECGYIKRPPSRPYAGTSMHDPEGNVFDLFERKGTGDNLYHREDLQRQPTYLTHLVLKCLDPEKLSTFYQSLFGLAEIEKDGDGCYLSDGVVTLVLSKYRIADYEGMGIPLPGLEHLGFAVPNLKEFEERVQGLIDQNMGLTPLLYTTNHEANLRKDLFAKCPLGQLQLSDPEGVLIDVSEATRYG